MLVLDTDHLTEFQRGTSVEAHRLKRRLDRAAEPYATTIITVEETVRGWMAAIHRVREPRRQISAYARLQQLFRFFATWNVLEWSETAADEFESSRRAKIRIGTMDLKIASIALTYRFRGKHRVQSVGMNDPSSRGGQASRILAWAKA